LTTPYLPELNELAEKALSSVAPDLAADSVITKGLLIAEVLVPGEEHRGLLSIQLGRQGELTPWDTIGLLSPVEMTARAAMAGFLLGGDHEH
jgi:hypothetical protein